MRDVIFRGCCNFTSIVLGMSLESVEVGRIYYRSKLRRHLVAEYHVF